MLDPWTEHQHSRLLVLWGEGVSTRLIGEQIGKSKNAVVGMVHRLGLPARRSPILRGVEPKKRVWAKRAPKVTLPEIKVKPLPVELVRAAALKPPPQPAKPVWIAPIRECCWPIGDPRSKSFRFCEAATHPGKQYCATHWEVAYRQVDYYA